MNLKLVDLLLAASLFVTGVIHLIPAIGVMSAQRLNELYGVAVEDPSLILLLRHRALMFAILGVFFVSAAFVPGWRLAAVLVALVGMLSFVMLAGSAPLTPAILRVVRVDMMLVALLIAVLTLRWIVVAR